METRLMMIFTRTPLHIGTGASVGAIDQPVLRERHTGFPVIPASSLKGVFADQWNDKLVELSDKDKKKRVRVADEKNCTEAAWLFGSDNNKFSFAGSVQFSEARLLAFPARSAKGSFAWITSPLILHRAVRDGVINKDDLPDFKKLDLKDGIAIVEKDSIVAVNDKIVLEEYAFKTVCDDKIKTLGEKLQTLMPEELVWADVVKRLVVLSDGMMSYFARNSCEVSQHVRINDETGTAEGGALFNQEDVPSETMFYSIVHFLNGRGKLFKDKKPIEAYEAFKSAIKDKVFQFGGDASTGLGWCSIKLS